MEEIASSTSDKELEFLSKIARITILHAQFEYGEGRKIFEQLDTTGISINSLSSFINTSPIIFIIIIAKITFIM